MASPSQNQATSIHQPSPMDAALSEHCFLEWMALQERDLAELVAAQSLANHQEATQNVHIELVRKNIQHFENYIRDRSELARVDASPYFAPGWCTSLENSLLWIGGCRPSMFIRFVYALCGSEINSQVMELLNSYGSSGSSSTPCNNNNNRLGELSSRQLELLNKLQARTIKEEERLSSRVASLQEEIADQPLALIAQKTVNPLVPDSDREAEQALEVHEKAMAAVMEEADGLRMTVLKEVMRMLTLAQAIEFLAAGKKLHLCVHEWGKRMDHKHGRN